MKRYDGIKNDRPLDQPLDFDDTAASIHVEVLLLLGDRTNLEQRRVSVRVLSKVVHNLLAHRHGEEAHFLAVYTNEKARSEPKYDRMLTRIISQKIAAADLVLVGDAEAALEAAASAGVR